MKRKTRILGLLLAVVMLAGLLPAAAFAAEEPYNLWVDGVRVTPSNQNNIPITGGGSAKYDPTTQTLELKDVNLTHKADNKVIRATTPINDLTVKGNGKISNTDGLYGIFGNEYLTIEGEFEITAQGCGIFSYKNITITNGSKITITSTEGNSDAIFAFNDIVIKGGSVVNAVKTGGDKNATEAICADNSITITGNSEVTATTTNYNAIFANKGDLTISGGAKVTASSKSNALRSDGGEIKLEGVVFIEGDAHASSVKIGPAPAQYTVTYAVEGGELGSGDKTSEKVYEGYKPASVPTGMTPDGTHKLPGAWYKDSETTPCTPSNVAITGNVKFTFKFTEKDQFTVTYAVEGGEFGTGDKTSEKVYDGYKPTNVPTGMTPDGTHKLPGAWYKDSETTPCTPSNVAITGNVKFTFKFTEKDQFTVTYAVEGGEFGTGDKTSETVYDGYKPASVPTGMSPDATHKNAGAWYKDSETTSCVPSNVTITGNVKFTFKFTEKDQFTVTYAVEGGTFGDGDKTSETVYEGGKPTSVPTGMTPDGTHKPSGAWYKDSETTSCVPSNVTITGNVKFTYKFDEKDKFTVTYAVEGGEFGTGDKTSEKVYDGYKPASVPTGMSPDGTHKLPGAWYKGTETTPCDPSNVAITGNVKFTYKFTEKDKPSITTDTLPNGTAGVSYSVSLVASGDTPIEWSVTAGAVPAGLTVGTDGKISGTPTAAGTTKFTVEAKNVVGAVTKEFSITISPNISGGIVMPTTPTEEENTENDSPSKKFKDVDQNAWYIEYIDYVLENNLMNGVSEDKFAPNATTTRAMIVTILHRLEGKPAVSGSSPFEDVASGQWYTDAVIWAAENGIVNGYGNGKFGTNELITREQFAAIMYRYAKYKGYDVSKAADLSGYTDVSSISAYALDAMKWAVGAKLINGRTAYALVPQGNATRAEAAAILMRFIENVK